MAWTPAPGTLETVIVVNPVTPVTITWTGTPNQTVVGYRIVNNQLPPSVSVTPSATGISISGTATGLFGWVDATYLDNNDQLVTFVPTPDLLSSMPAPGTYKHLISAHYDSTPSITKTIDVAADWQDTQTTPGTTITGSATATYSYTFLNDWTESHTQITAVVANGG